MVELLSKTKVPMSMNWQVVHVTVASAFDSQRPLLVDPRALTTRLVKVTTELALFTSQVWKLLVTWSWSRRKMTLSLSMNLTCVPLVPN